MVSTIQLAPTSSSDYGTGIKVTPMTDEEQTNVKTCFWLNGTQSSPVTLQSVIPDTTSFEVSFYFQENIMLSYNFIQNNILVHWHWNVERLCG